jgi:hypothetical protein
VLAGPLADHLASVELEHGDRRVAALLIEDAAHAELLCDYSGAHGLNP